LNLSFGRAEVGALFLGVLLGALVCGDGQSNWYKGVQLVTIYSIMECTLVPVRRSSGRATRHVRLAGSLHLLRFHCSQAAVRRHCGPQRFIGRIRCWPVSHGPPCFGPSEYA
jgi:hypothetical protein